MERIKDETEEVEIPSGYKVVLKKRIRYGSEIDIFNKTIGETEITPETENYKVKLQQSSLKPILTILHHIVSWDITVDGQPLEVTAENINNTLYEDDINFLMAKIEGYTPDPKKETGSLSEE